MKKVICVLLAAILLCACVRVERQSISSSEIKEEKSQEIIKVEETKPEKRVFDGEDVVSKLDVKHYKYNSFGFYYDFMEVTNNSDCTADIRVNALYYDSEDNLISAETMDENVLMPNHSALLYSMPNEEWARCEYELIASEPSFYKGAQDDLSYEVSLAKEKIVVTMTNNGSEAAMFAKGEALFFMGDEVVGHSSTYFTDDDSELKPSASISKNLDCYKDFDGYKFYANGYRY